MGHFFGRPIILKIVCIDSGNYLGRGVEYVTKLHDMVRRNLPDGLIGQFIVFTDYQADYGLGITVRRLPGYLKGWWNKLALFQHGQFSDDDRVVYFDLDTVITGKLDDIVSYDGEFAILRDFYRPHGYQSSVMAWTPCPETKQIWTSWVSAKFPEIDGGDQAWIEQRVNNPDLWQKLYPVKFASYKVNGCAGSPPKGASVIVFHGKPRPHDLTSGWVPQVWKIGGGTMASLETVCNTEESTILGNARSACLRQIPWLEIQPEHKEACAIVGGGPSLLETIDTLPDMPMFALNAAATWLLNRPKASYRIAQIITDARPDMAAMVDRRALRHFFSAQCDPSVFEVEGTNPTLFHPDIPGIDSTVSDGKTFVKIGGGSTVGLQALVIAYALGYRTIHLVGMDSSYRNGEGHAYAQPLNDGERIIDVTVGDRTFQCAPWMAQQAEEFQVVAAELANLGCEIVVHGDGLLPAVAHDLQGRHARAEAGIIEEDGSPACQRASEVTRHLVGIEKPIGAEIGVFRGTMSRRLLGYNPNLTLYMVDSWSESPSDGDYATSGDWHAKLTQSDQDRYAAEAIGNVAFAGLRAIVLRKTSEEAAKSVPDGTLDFVFLDADHSYAGCASDIRVWMPKLKPGGLLCGHDWENLDFPEFGVTQAVTEFAAKTGLSIDLGANLTWFIRMPCAISSAA